MITTSVMEKKKRRTHYVINADFYDALIKYKDRVKQAEEKEQPKPRIPEYIGKCFLEKKTLELYDMLLEKNGFDEVFHDDSADGDYSNYSDFNSIKDSVHSRMRY